MMLGIFCLAGLYYIVFYLSPNQNGYLIPALLALIFLTIFFLTSSLLKSIRRATMLGLFAVSALYLRLKNFTSPLSLLLLLIIFIGFELFYFKYIKHRQKQTLHKL